MIQVLLLILKIIGILILAILGLLLLILALVLFVPVCYRIRIVHNTEKTQVKGRVSFLFPLLLVTFSYLKKIAYKVRVFGISLVDSEKPEKEKQTKTIKTKKKKKTKKKPEQEILPESVQEIKEEKTKPDITEQEAVTEAKTDKETVSQQQENDSVVSGKKEKQGFFDKIKCKIRKIRETISKVTEKIKKLFRQKEEVQRILAKPETKQALGFTWDKLKHLLKHVLPRKIKGYVIFGAEDPATTGQVLGILGVVYARTGQLLEIRPNFMEKQLECDVELKGRIQVFTLLVIAVKVFMNRELRQLIKDFKGIKEI